MQYETALGLRKAHTFDEVRSYIQNDPDKIQYPKRDALFLQKSHIYAQVEASMRNYGDAAQLDQARYRESGESAPYVPPKPKPESRYTEEEADAPMEDPRVDTHMDDQITGGPSPPPPQLAGAMRSGYNKPLIRGLKGLLPRA
jgi:hypothetical protein